jgi:hypothetical protein
MDCQPVPHQQQQVKLQVELVDVHQLLSTWQRNPATCFTLNRAITIKHSFRSMCAQRGVASREPRFHVEHLHADDLGRA